MKSIKALIDSGRKLIIDQSEGYVGEQNCEMIEIDIGPFAQENYDFFVLNFDNGISGGTFPSNTVSTAEDEPAYIDNGVIYCPIDASHTASGSLKIQLEAHKTVDGRVTIKKSSVACISFGYSLMGQVNTPVGSNPVFERLADAEGRIASAESRIAGIEKENFGAAIDSVDERVSTLEDNAEATEDFVRDADRRISVIEGYDIPKNFNSLGQKIEDLENDFENFDALTSIPAADEKNLGGVKISENSEVFINGKGILGLRYGNLNMYSLSALLTVALLYESGRVETVVGNTPDAISSTVYGLSTQVFDGMIEAAVFSAFESGEITWFNENFENTVTKIVANTVYILRFIDGKMVLDSCSASGLRGLILEGI